MFNVSIFIGYAPEICIVNGRIKEKLCVMPMKLKHRIFK
jgi:hypothetical protein